MIEEIKSKLGPRIPWAYFIKEENIADVAPLVYSEIKRLRIENDFSGKTLKKLNNVYRSVLANNIVLMNELGKVLSSFQKAGFQAILLKGSALINDVYKDPGMRVMRDIDLLVRKSDLKPVSEILGNLGYENNSLGEEDFVKKISGRTIDIDIHTDFINATRLKSRAGICNIDYAQVWENKRRIKIGDIDIFVLSKEDFLIDLCVHLVMHHGMNGLLWFLDIIYFLDAHKEIDLAKLAILAKKYSVKKPLYLTLCYLKETLKMQTTECVLGKLKYTPGFLENIVFKEIKKGKEIPYAKFFFALSSIKGLKNKAVFLKELVFPPVNILREKYAAKGTLSPYIAHFTNIIKGL